MRRAGLAMSQYASQCHLSRLRVPSRQCGTLWYALTKEVCRLMHVILNNLTGDPGTRLDGRSAATALHKSLACWEMLGAVDNLREVGREK